MATDAENIATFIAALTAELASISPQRSYSIDGQAVDHNAYRASLLANLREARDLQQGLSGPFTVELEVTT